MPPKRILPSADNLLSLRSKGWNNVKIAEKYGVTPAAVSAALGREGKSESTKRYPELIPWRVAGEHENDYNLRMLRWEGRIRTHQPVHEYQRKAVRSWKAKLKAEKVVITYDAETGFSRVPMRVGEDLVRKPGKGRLSTFRISFEDGSEESLEARSYRESDNGDWLIFLDLTDEEVSRIRSTRVTRISRLPGT